MTTHKKFLESQINLLVFIDNYITEKGYAPSVREICDYTGLSSTGTVQRRLVDMEQRGWITRNKNTNRCIVVNKHSLPFEDEIKQTMQKIDNKYNKDVEAWHGEADDLLCEILDKLGYGFVTEWFNNHPKWYA